MRTDKNQNRANMDILSFRSGILSFVIIISVPVRKKLLCLGILNIVRGMIKRSKKFERLIIHVNAKIPLNPICLSWMGPRP